MKKNRLFHYWTTGKPVFILLALLSSFFVGNAQNQNTGTAANGTFTITKLANATTVPSGGGSVTYTYTVKNISTSPIYYVSLSDNKISSISYVSGMTTTYLQASGFALGDVAHLYGKQTLAAGASAVFTATQNITQTTTNTVTATFGTTLTGVYPFGGVGVPLGVNITGTSAGTAAVTVTLTAGTAASCGTIWYTTDINNGTTTCNNPGEIGTITAAGVTTPKFTTGGANGTNGTLVGAAALAVNPANPDLIYYIPRDAARTTYGGLYAYSQTSGTSTTVATAANTPTPLVRLGVSADGTVWTIDGSGVLYSLKSPATTFTNHGTIVLPTNSIGAPTAWSSLGSGDLAFDGNGTMYFIGSSSSPVQAYLFSLTAANLATNGPTATLIGSTGTSSTYNGIAFGDDGTLYASATVTGLCNSTLSTVNVTTGAATVVATITGKTITDLGSCSLPSPVLSFTKTASQSGSALAGTTVTYTLTVANIGTLVASNVALQDAIPTGSTYVANSTTLNGVPVVDPSANVMPYSTANTINSTGAGTGRVASGSSAVVTFQIFIASTATGSICNQGNVTYTGFTGTLLSDDPNVPGSADPTCLGVLPNYTVSGIAYDDNNGATGGVNGTVLAGVTVQIKNAAGTTIGTTTTAADGTYSFTNLALNAGAYTVVVTPPTATPAYQNVSSTGLSQTAGNTAITIVAANVTGVNFGLHQPPTAVTFTQAAQSNPGGTGTMTAAAASFGGTDHTGGTITSLTITTFPTNTTSITINNINYTSTTFPVGGVTIPTSTTGVPSQTILVDPREATGNPSPVITYTVLDAAGLSSPTATVTLPISVVLPVQLISFVGNVNNCNVNLNWVTANEQNFNYFDVQYSADGLQFTSIGKINGKSGTQQNTYAFATTQATGNGLYRLGMVDKDASIVYSSTVNVNVQCANGGIKWNVFPNPITVGSAVNITLNNLDAQESKVRVVIMSLLGQKLQDYTVNLKVGTNNASIPAASLQGGTYMVNVYDAQGKAIGSVQKLLFR